MAADTPAARELASLVDGAAAPANEIDAIDGVLAGCVVEPASNEAFAAVLRWCSTHRQSVVIRGGGTHLAWGRRPLPVSVILSTRRLNRITRYEPGDLTVSVQSGLSIAALNSELAKHGQWLPLDVASEDATVGGAIATNDSGPLRHRYGTPRDQVIGIGLATADGRLASAGGQVVKNVAGYDLAKLMAGSFGALAGIVGATFKLAPIPPEFTTLAVSFADASSLAAAAAAVSASQLDPVCIEAEAGFGETFGYRLLVRFGGTPPANADQVTAAARLMAASKPKTQQHLVGEDDAAFWRSWAERRHSGAGAMVRASWLPARLVQVLTLLDGVHRQLRVSIDFAGRAAVGTGTFLIQGDVEAQARAIDALRHTDAIGHVVIMRSSPDVKARADVWGPPTPAAVMTDALKSALDPSGILNAARGPV
jgi:glycolate oxidase FAD binding subunit